MHPVLSGLLTILFPQENACHLCSRFAGKGVLCSRCWNAMSEHEMPPGRQTAFRNDGLYAMVACWKHRGVPRQLVHQLKYRTDPRAALLLADGMVRVLQNTHELLEGMDLLVPVPLHPEREKKRGYNQAALLAQEISRQTGLALETDVLFRTRSTETLVNLDRAQRLESMRGAFAVARPEAVKDKRILLVDDVFTTGATSLACAEALRYAGAAKVCVVTACRA